MFLSSERGKRILNFLYSWGAAIVIIGALFKLLHLPYANQILFAAMITEACVFFISGFERPDNEYHWEEVFPVLNSKNPLDRPDFAGGGSGAVIVGDGSGGLGDGVGGIGDGASGIGGGAIGIGGGAGGISGGTFGIGGGAGGTGGGAVVVGGGAGGAGGGAIIVGGGATGIGGGDAANVGGGDAAGTGGGMVIIGGMPGTAGMGTGSDTGMAGGGVFCTPTEQPAPKPSPQHLVNAGMATMGLNISEQDSEVLAESIKKLNSAAEQISKMADLTEATQSYIDQISTVSRNMEKFGEITSSLGEVSDTLINSCKAISGSAETDAEEKPKNYVEQMSKLNENISELNRFYESQFSGLRSQMETVHLINAGLNRIRDLYDSSIVDSAAFRNENERMAQLLTQLNQVYSRLLQAMTVNIQGGGYPPAGQPGYPPYQGGYR
ncbi:MAG: gliding motility protein GldL [Tannerella sp.]|nr:gliding motility protein GldL [Tannerella sp.]